jgi:serine/threonine protein kinase
MGTARWAAPEQMMFGTLSKATDVYSFGMTAYEVFTGRAPFAHTPDALLLTLVVDRKLRPPRPPIEDAPVLDNASWTFVDTCWADEASARPSASRIEAALKGLQNLRAPLPSVTDHSPEPVAPSSLIVAEPDHHQESATFLTPPSTPPNTTPASRNLDARLSQFSDLLVVRKITHHHLQRVCVDLGDMHPRV